jgi:hypothetical protein
MMVVMSPDPPPADLGIPPPESVVEFGAEPGPARSRRRRWSFAALGKSLAADRRLIPIAAVLGAVALFASLVSEWQVTAMDAAQFGGTLSGNQPVPTDVGQLGAWGAGYLAGLFVLVGAAVLLFFGPPAGRRYAWLAGLSTGGLLLALLVALAPTLDDTSRTLDAVFKFGLSDNQFELSTGRGVWCALIGVAAVTLSIYLAGRDLPAWTAAPAGTAELDGVEAPEPPPNVWSWRNPRDADDEQPPDAPFDLTVTSTTPFTSLNDDRDKPSDKRAPGISG